MAHSVPEVEPPQGEEPRATLDPRVERTRRLALETAFDLFREGGWDAVTHLAVSERSGIGRTTLYRHWPDAASLLKELVVFRAGADETTPTGELRRDLVAELEHLRCMLLDPGIERAVLTVMERAAVDSAYADLRATITTECSRQLTALVHDASADGRLRAGLDPAVALAELAGPLVFRRLFCRDDLPPSFVEAVVDDFLAARGTIDAPAAAPSAVTGGGARPARAWAGRSGGRPGRRAPA